MFRGRACTTGVFLLVCIDCGETQPGEWGPSKDGIATRLVPLQEKYVLGRPMRFRLELRNETSTRMQFDQQTAQKRSLLITGPGGKRAPYIGPSYSTIAHYRRVDPGKVVVLFEVDITPLYYLGKPGSYSVRFNGEGFSVFERPPGPHVYRWLPPALREPKDPGRTVMDLPFEAIEVEVLQGELEHWQVVVGRLLDVLPGRFRITAAVSDKEVTPTGRESASGAKVRAGAITVWETDREVDTVPQERGRASVVSEYWGRNERGHVYVRMPPQAEYLWPEARWKLAAALDVAGTAPPTPEGVKRVIGLREALKAGDVREVEAIIKAHPDIIDADLYVQRTKGGWLGGTPLHWSVQIGDVGTAETLLNHHADVNAVYSWYRSTPLHCAARLGRKELVRVLLDHGAEINAKDRVGKTPLFEAAGKGHAHTVTVLLDGGANINEKAKSVGGRTPLHAATGAGHVEVVKILLARGADRNAVTRSDCRTPLHIAAHCGRKGVVEVLLTSGADVDAKDKKGKTPLVLAKEKGREEIVRLLREHGAKD